MVFYMTKSFARFARRQCIPASSLVDAVRCVAAGDTDADLGGGLYKQRVARAGGGKSGGYRTLLAHRVGGHVFFLHGFAKQAQDNIDGRELRALKAWGGVLHGLGSAELATARDAGELMELNDDDCR